MISQNKIRILYVVSTLRRAGPTNQLFNIVSNLDHDIFESKILTLSNESQDSLLGKFLDAGINVESLGLGRIKGALFGKNRIRKIVGSFMPDVVHTQGIRADSLAVNVLKGMGVSTIATIRCIPSEDYTMRYGNFIGKVMAKHHLRVLKKVDVVAAVSSAIGARLKDSSLDTIVVRNGCDINKYHPIPRAEKMELRRKLNIPENQFILISVGHLASLKDPITIIKAFRSASNNPKYFLIFLGDGHLMEECVKIAGSIPNVRFEGRVSNVDQYLKASDAFISSSLSEGMPNTVLESLASGLPTVLSKIPQHEEVFLHENDKPPFFEPGDVPRLTTILEELNEDDIRKLPTRQIIEQHFDAVRMSGLYQESYRALAERVQVN